MSVSQNMNETAKTFVAIMSLGLIGLVFLIIFGNLSGNLGFSSGSQGDNDTNLVINNLTQGATKFFSFTPTWFILLAVVLLIIIVISVISVVRGVGGGKGGFT